MLWVFVETSPVLGNLDYSFCCGKFIFYMVLQSEMNILHGSCVDLILCILGGQLCAVCLWYYY